jgi:methylthioribose-1-phosphate isomerase
LCTDATIPAVIDQEPIDAVIVGADTVLASGDVVNKTGTRSAALAAQEVRIPVFVVAATDKISPDTTPHWEEGPPAAVYDGTADIRVLNPIFDVTPAAWVAGWITEQGIWSRDEVGRQATTHGGWRAWMHASPDSASG